jgi:hypothetical protein
MRNDTAVDVFVKLIVSLASLEREKRLKGGTRHKFFFLFGPVTRKPTLTTFLQMVLLPHFFVIHRHYFSYWDYSTRT